MNAAMWQDIRQAFNWVDETAEARVAVIEGEGKHFTSGIDLQMMMGLPAFDRRRLRWPHARKPAPPHPRPARHPDQPGALPQARAGGHCRRLHRRRHRLITCADMRYCSATPSSPSKEIDIGMVADVGTLQRLPKLIGQGITRELAYTGRSSTPPRRKASAW